MKLMKRKGSTDTIRKIYDSDKEIWLGVVGTVEDLLKDSILLYCDYPGETWAFIPAPGTIHTTTFGATRADALENLKEVILE